MFSLVPAIGKNPFSHDDKAPVDCRSAQTRSASPQMLSKLRLPLPGPYRNRTIPDFQALSPRVEDDVVLDVEAAGCQPRVDSPYRLPAKDPVATLNVWQAGSITIENRDCSHEADIAISIMNIKAVLPEGYLSGYQLLKVLAG